jgi:hypothetical protein
VEDPAASPPLPPAKKIRWENETEAQKSLHGDDDEEEFLGLNYIVGRSVDEDYRQITLDPRQALGWSTRDHGANFFDFAGPSEPPASKEEEDDDDDWSFRTSSNDGNNLDFSDVDACRCYIFLFLNLNLSNFCKFYLNFV